jgi:hypothetical protein
VYIVGQDPIEIRFPPDYTGRYLVEQGLHRFRDRRARKETVDGFVQRPALLNLPYDLNRN